VVSILTATDVEKRFGLVTALAGTSLAVEANEIHGLIGPNGSGKSTLLHVIAGRTAPDAGTVRLAGRDVSHDPPSRRARDGLSIKFQLARIYREQTAAENVLLALQAKEGLVALMLSRSRQRLRPHIAGLLERVGLADVRDRPAGQLSHGQQQWLEIAMAMATGPKVLLLDEPTAGMSRQERIRTGEVIRAASEYCAVVIVEHDLDFIRELCDRIDVLHQGRSIASGTPAEIERNGQVADVYLTHA
jgi:branched-chain amino acid transport system ATP-binding protein